MQVSDVWLTPEQAAAVSGRSMIAIRALLQTTVEDDGVKHLIQVFDDGQGAVQYRLHRSLVTSDGLRRVEAQDVIDVLSRRVEELESELEVLRLRTTSMRFEDSPKTEPVAPPVVQPNVEPVKPRTDNSTWVILGGIILITIVITIYILYRQGFLIN